MYYKTIQSPIGNLTITSDQTHLTGIFHSEADAFDRYLNLIVAQDDDAAIEKTCRWLTDYFALQQPSGSLPVKLEGTAFQMEVWQILQQIPYGATMTYGQIAQQIARMRGVEKFSAQAVGGAVGKNPISIYIPCHRVIGAKNQLTGYHGGLQRKIKLLQLEATKCNNR